MHSFARFHTGLSQIPNYLLLKSLYLYRRIMAILSPLMLKLTTAGAEDTNALVSMAEKIWRVHYPPIIGSEQVEYMLRNMHSSDKVLAQMNDGQIFSFIMDGNDRIGYTSWSYQNARELFISKFYVDPAKQGKGIGRKVFAEIVESHPEIRTITLTVNRKNYKSINFYFRLGFVIEEVKDFDIGNGYYMNDFVMKWNRG